MSGLCCTDAWECSIGAVQTLELAEVLADSLPSDSPSSTNPAPALDDTTIEKRRFDPAQNEALSDVMGRFARAFGYTAENLAIEPTLAQLLRLRVSQLNHCAFCLNLHAQAARDMGATRAQVDTLSAWWETDLYSDAERAALAYCDVLTTQAETTARHPFQEVHDRLAEHYSEREITDLAAIVINMNAWTRLKMASGETPVS